MQLVVTRPRILIAFSPSMTSRADSRQAVDVFAGKRYRVVRPMMHLTCWLLAPLALSACPIEDSRADVLPHVALEIRAIRIKPETSQIVIAVLIRIIQVQPSLIIQHVLIPLGLLVRLSAWRSSAFPRRSDARQTFKLRPGVSRCRWPDSSDGRYQDSPDSWPTPHVCPCAL